jgi:hypothetical protein
MKRKSTATIYQHERTPFESRTLESNSIETKGRPFQFIYTHTYIHVERVHHQRSSSGKIKINAPSFVPSAALLALYKGLRDTL